MGNNKNNNTKDLTADSDWMEEEDYGGQLAIDAYQTNDDVIIQAPIAGVRPENLDLSITDEAITIKGERRESQETEKDNYFCQECYWGSFSRTYVLPVAVDTDKASASLKNGILTIRIPKLEKTKTKKIQVNFEQ